MEATFSRDPQEHICTARPGVVFVAQGQHFHLELVKHQIVDIRKAEARTVGAFRPTCNPREFSV